MASPVSGSNRVWVTDFVITSREPSLEPSNWGDVIDNKRDPEPEGRDDPVGKCHSEKTRELTDAEQSNDDQPCCQQYEPTGAVAIDDETEDSPSAGRNERL